jgi:hypothetical protein
MTARVRETYGVSRRYPDGTRRWHSRTISTGAGWYAAGALLRLCLLAIAGLFWVIFEVYLLPGSLLVALARTATRPWVRFHLAPLGPFRVVAVEWPPGPPDPPAPDGDLTWA